MKVYRNVSQVWESEAEDIDDTSYEGYIYVSPDLDELHLEDPTYADSLMYSLDVVIVKSLRIGGKVLWDNHMWKIEEIHKINGNSPLGLFGRATHKLYIRRPRRRPIAK